MVTMTNVEVCFKDYVSVLQIKDCKDKNVLEISIAHKAYKE